jgi:hypothetical protein
MAHEVAASGGGFLWPRLTFVSDGDTVSAECRASDSQNNEALRYISWFDEDIPASAFETGVDQFINLVLERLGGGDAANHLHAAWSDVVAERADPESTRYRRAEAMLGYDPDESRDSVADILALAEEIGDSAAMEIAAICGENHPKDQLAQIRHTANGPGLLGRVETFFPQVPSDGTIPAHQRGATCAHWMRRQISLDTYAPIADEKLAELMGLTSAQIEGDGIKRPTGERPLSLAVEAPGPGQQFIFRNWRLSNRRFEAARMLFDVAAKKGEPWHPATAADTVRQKMQRSFAAEFLAPISGIRSYLRDDYSMDAIEGAAEYFDVTTWTIGTQLANHGDIHRSHPAVPRA